MWWIVIIGIILFVIYIVIKTYKIANDVAMQGGMRVKYKILVDGILNSHPKAKIFQETRTSISLGISGMGGAVVFLIQQSSGGFVTIQWKVDSPFFGKCGLEWIFDEFLDQNKMMEKMNNDITIRETNRMKKYM